MKYSLKLVVSIIGCELVGVLGTPFTIPAIPSWYTNLNKPVFAPPNWIFGPAWTLLYFLMGIAFYLIWKQGFNKKKIKSAGRFFAAQLGLNFIWSPVFFGLRSPLLGLIVIITMLTLIVITMKKFYTLSHLAFYLLVPYLIWVTFATVLNVVILMIN